VSQFFGATGRYEGKCVCPGFSGAGQWLAGRRGNPINMYVVGLDAATYRLRVAPTSGRQPTYRGVVLPNFAGPGYLGVRV
jgi:hypothetical protein